MNVRETLTTEANTNLLIDNNEELIPENASWDHIDLKAEAAEYQGKKVTLNKPIRTPNERKAYKVFVKNKSGKVIIVRFGDPASNKVRNDSPERRRRFRARHKCDTRKDPTTPVYWACRTWE